MKYRKYIWVVATPTFILVAYAHFESSPSQEVVFDCGGITFTNVVSRSEIVTHGENTNTFDVYVEVCTHRYSFSLLSADKHWTEVLHRSLLVPRDSIEIGLYPGNYTIQVYAVESGDLIGMQVF